MSKRGKDGAFVESTQRERAEKRKKDIYGRCLQYFLRYLLETQIVQFNMFSVPLVG